MVKKGVKIGIVILLVVIVIAVVTVVLLVYLNQKHSCASANPNYVRKNLEGDPLNWSGGDRNTSIWLLNHFGGMSVADGQSMTNAQLQPLILALSCEALT